MRYLALAAALVALGVVAGSVAAAPRNHTVAAGQTLGAIARRYRVTIKELCDANDLRRSDVIRPGQRLRIPSPGSRSRRRAAPTQSAQATHTVAAGQTLGAIARRYRISIRELCQANGIQRTDVIRVGQTLRIPGPGAVASPARARQHRASQATRTHVVARGHTLGKIASRYDVSIAELCRANGIQRAAKIRPGQRLVIPDPSATGSSRQRSVAPVANGAARGPRQLEVSGSAPVYYYEPVGPGRLTLRPVIFYLHGRGGDPARDCQRWASVARRLGWLVCPGGPSLHGAGRAWNNWVSGERILKATLAALRSKYGRRVQLYGNTLIGFSEGAYVAMNVGVRNARTFNRWMILAASDAYWGGKGIKALRHSRGRIRRVYLITGGRDSVVQRTHVVRQWLRRARVATRITTPQNLAHEVALDSNAGLYRTALVWLNRGG